MTCEKFAMKNKLDVYACAEKLRELEARLEALEQRVDAYHSPGKEANQITLYVFDADGSVVKEKVDIAAFLEAYSMQGMEVVVDYPPLYKDQMDELQHDGVTVLAEGIPCRSRGLTLLKYWTH